MKVMNGLRKEESKRVEDRECLVVAYSNFRIIFGEGFS